MERVDTPSASMSTSRPRPNTLGPAYQIEPLNLRVCKHCPRWAEYKVSSTYGQTYMDIKVCHECVRRYEDVYYVQEQREPDDNKNATD
jgi:hypothetical protein